MRQTFEDEVLAPSRQRSRRRLAIATLVAAVVAALGLLATGTAPADAAKKPDTESALLQAAKAAPDDSFKVIVQGAKSERSNKLVRTVAKDLAKNLGVDTAKPDRHLVRVAEATGYASPASLCEHLARMVGDTVAVVDLVIWRFATISADYLEFFRRRRCSGVHARSDHQQTTGSRTIAWSPHGPRCVAG